MPNRFKRSDSNPQNSGADESLYLESPSDPLKMVGHYPKWGHGPIFDSGQQETPGRNRTVPHAKTRVVSRLASLGFRWLFFFGSNGSQI